MTPDPAITAARINAVAQQLDDLYRTIAQTLDGSERLSLVSKAQALNQVESNHAKLEEVLEDIGHDLDASYLAITVIDHHKQTVLAARGPIKDCSRESSYCHVVAASSRSLQINDNARHPFFRSVLGFNPAGIRAYLGVPLTPRPNITLGSLCAIDTRPRTWSDADKATLLDHVPSVLAVLAP